MTNKKIFFWISTVLAGFIFQMFFSDVFSISGIAPNFLLLGTIFCGINFGPVAGEWTGFVWGLFADVASISIFGSQTFMLTLIGYLMGRLQGKIDEEKPVAQLGLVLVMSFFFVLGLFALENFFGGASQRFRLQNIIFQPIYSALISPILFWLLVRWCSWFH